MKLVVISPETYEPREHAVLAGLFAAGLERYHVRKPSWDEHAVRRFVQAVPPDWRGRLVLHQHHGLAVELGCGGLHFKDSECRARPPGAPRFSDGPAVRPYLFTSRSCHALTALGKSLGYYDSVFFSPVFASISKVGYRPSEDLGAVSAFLQQRAAADPRTPVIALGGITPENCVQAIDYGFDGVAVLGSLWQADAPLKVFDQFQQTLSTHAA